MWRVNIQDQLQTQHSADIGNYIMDKQHKMKGKLQEHIFLIELLGDPELYCN
jgi:hypothetical protein